MRTYYKVDINRDDSVLGLFRINHNLEGRIVSSGSWRGRGVLEEASVVITEGASLPMAGVLTILPALAVTGLLEAGEAVYGRARAAFYGLRSLLFTVVLAALLGQRRAEGLTRMDPADLGRLISLDRAPEVKTLRRRIEELAGEGRAEALIGELARHQVAAHASACAVLYVDGHVRAYHGGAACPRRTGADASGDAGEHRYLGGGRPWRRGAGVVDAAHRIAGGRTAPGGRRGTCPGGHSLPCTASPTRRGVGHDREAIMLGGIGWGRKVRGSRE
jgi:prepilin-type processing-associated H-X9-DG protein